VCIRVRVHFLTAYRLIHLIKGDAAEIGDGLKHRSGVGAELCVRNNPNAFWADGAHLTELLMELGWPGRAELRGMCSSQLQ
jgi:hypothetical protein